MIEGKSRFQEAMGGNLNKNEYKRSINIQFSEEIIKELERRSEEEDVPRNKYIGIALEHYWKCNNVRR